MSPRLSRPSGGGSRGRRTVRPERLVTSGLLVRRVPIQEADLVLTLFTRDAGKVTAIARGARRSQRRFAGLEPIHGLRLTLDRKPGADMWSLVESTLERARSGVTGRLDRLEAAGRALGWVRAGTGAAPEPGVWDAITELLDVLDEGGDGHGDALLVRFGLTLLAELGWGLDLDACVGCGKPCAAQSAAQLDPKRGGIVCRACGTATRVLSASFRRALIAARDGDLEVARPGLDVQEACAIVDDALRGHTS